MKLDSRINNFSLLKFIGAFLVLAGHMGAIYGAPTPTIIFGYAVHVLGVMIIFIISGYFMAVSLRKKENYFIFIGRKIFRLWSAYAASVVLSVIIIGVFFTTLSADEFFLNKATVDYVLNNLRFFISYLLPGAFTQNPLSTVNGSLWTIPVEVVLIIVIPLVVTLGYKILEKLNLIKFKAAIAFSSVALICLLKIFILIKTPTQTVMIYATDWIAALNLICYYLIGMLFSIEGLKKRLNATMAVCALLVLNCFAFNSILQELFLMIALPFFTISVGFMPQVKISKFLDHIQISYGFYLYAFIIQQCVVAIMRKYDFSISFNFTIIITTIIAIFFGLFSSYVIEKPSLKLINHLTKKNGKLNK